MPKTNQTSARFKTFSLTGNALNGFNLIDASAGTGKTYTICGLVLRLLIEKNLSIDQILVVTYTEAATEDLRNRIRQKIRQALEAISTGQSDDAFLQEYLYELKKKPEAGEKLNDALRSFDEAAIFTIHSFCQRMLLENSFESNLLFDTELVADDSYLIREIIEDFWRLHFYRTSHLFTEYISGRLSPERLQDFLNTFLPRPLVRFIPEIDFEEGCGKLAKAETEYIEAFNIVCTAWESDRTEVSADLLNSNKLRRNIYKKEQIQDLLLNMDEMAAACRPSLHLFDKFNLFARSRIIAATRTNEAPSVLPFYDTCENLLQAHSRLTARFDRCLLALKKKLADSFYSELDLRKKRANIFSFDDLLRKLHAGFSGPGGAAFSRSVAQKYPAVLIDEFQDTDPLQFEIFSSLYKNGSLLFLIGDPKQAIYSFRGADIFTYMDAVKSGNVSHHTLDVNHRSTPELVKAVNALFCRSGKPFVFDAISFQPVYPAPEEEPEQLAIDGRREEPFVLWILDPPSSQTGTAASSDNKKYRLTKTSARRSVMLSVATEVARLLALAAEERACINGKRIHPGDIAILVRKNEEARKMQQVLTDFRVPSVIHSGDDLFTSEETKEMALLLEAIASPQDIRRVKTGLLTRIIDLRPNDIDSASAAAEEVVELWLERFKAYRRLWNRYGFIHMFWCIMSDNRVRSRMLGIENGERILTNILHLAEILHQEACDKGLDMSALLGYLQDRIAGIPAKAAEHQLRLESDADRVKIVTVHKAKGLEYSIVFCPFTWEGSRLTHDRGCIFHQQIEGEERTALIYDCGSSELETHMQIALQEELAENLRLLYVAVTRAIHRCYMAWGLIRGAETSGPAYLLHQAPAGNPDQQNRSSLNETGDNLINATRERFLQLSDSQFKADLQELTDASEASIRISSLSQTPGTFAFKPEAVPIRLRHRTFSGTIASDWKISSFSTLTKHKTDIVESISADENSVPGQNDSSIVLESGSAQINNVHVPEDFNIFSFPHGPRAGTMLHDLLEQVDFNAVHHADTERAVYEKLISYGYDPAWQPVLVEMLSNLSKTTLHKSIPGLTLASIHSENCLHELEFYFPLSRTTPKDVQNIFSRDILNDSPDLNGSLMKQQLGRLTFSPSRGFMKGFIDMVFEYQGKFYLVDWKSNFLGNHAENYHHGRLLEAMSEGFYFLQYHVYCLALHLYLRNRLHGYNYETHFGGAFYIFLRGIERDTEPGHSIFFDLPRAAMIKNLTDTLLAESSWQGLHT